MRNWRRLLIKTIVVLMLAAAIFGSAAWFGYNLFVRPHKELKEESALGSPTPPPDPTIPEFQKCMKLKQERKHVEARAAFENFIENYPASTKLEEAKDALGEINIDIFFSATPSPEKEQYIIQRGDALAKIEKKLKVPGELIMRSNNLEDPRRLQIGQVLYVSHPSFTVSISRKDKTVTLFNHGKFFKRYRAKVWKVPPSKNNQPISARVSELLHWKGDQPVAWGTKEYAGASHWVQISAGNYTLYTDPAEGGKEAPGGYGIILTAEEMEELSALLRRGVPVTIE
jgi:LysM repeat protein